MAPISITRLESRGSSSTRVSYGGSGFDPSTLASLVVLVFVIAFIWVFFYKLRKGSYILSHFNHSFESPPHRLTPTLSTPNRPEHFKLTFHFITIAKRKFREENIPYSKGRIAWHSFLIAITCGLVACCAGCGVTAENDDRKVKSTKYTAPQQTSDSSSDGGQSTPVPEMQSQAQPQNMDWTPVNNAASDPVQ